MSKINHYLGGLICVARMGFYTSYELLVMRTKDNGKGYQVGETRYHKLFGRWKFFVKKTNGRLHTIGLHKDHEVSLLDCVLHLERKRLRREQYK